MLSFQYAIWRWVIIVRIARIAILAIGKTSLGQSQASIHSAALQQTIRKSPTKPMYAQRSARAGMSICTKPITGTMVPRNQHHPTTK